MIIFGVDPGTARMGYGVLSYDGDSRLIAHGVLETPANSSMPYRLRTLFGSVCELLDAHRPQVLSIEQLFFARNVTTAISVGQARGVVVVRADSDERPGPGERAGGQDECHEEDQEDLADPVPAASRRSASERPSSALMPRECGLHEWPHDSIGSVNERSIASRMVETARRPTL